jgi:cytidyltransferase-like protein
MKLVVISGYFNPLHCGHLDYIEAAKELGDYLIVIVNNDDQVKIKGSVPFMNAEDRTRIVESLSAVDAAVVSIDKDGTVVESLAMIVEHAGDEVETVIFANGGDRVAGNTPEEVYCAKNDVETAYNVGGGKTQSSSELLADVQ